MENKNTPKLRFKEFTDEWQGKKLGDISDLITKGTTPTSVGFVFLREGINFIKAENISKNGFIDIESTPKISVECNESLKRSQLQQDDLLFSIAGTLGRTATVQKKDLPANTNQALAIVRLMKENNLGFIHLFLNLPVIKRRVYQILSIGAQPNLSLEQVGDFKISLPSRSEQQKIADFLGAVDEKIGKLEEKKKAFEKYKKGIMQAIFSQMIRFKKPDGSNYPDWEEEELGSVLVKNSKKNKDKKIILVQSVSNTMGFVNQVDYFERIIASKDLSNYYIIEKGTFAYNPSRIDVGSLAYKCDDRISVISPLYISFRPKPESINDGYLLSWFSSGEFLKQMNNMFEGSVRHTLNYDALKQMVINLPSPHEQEKIAGFLISLVNKVDLTYKQLEQAKLFKKSLLQQMFV